MHQQQAVWGRFPNKCELVLERGRQRGEGLERGRAEQWNITLKLGEWAGCGACCVKWSRYTFIYHGTKVYSTIFWGREEIRGIFGEKVSIGFSTRIKFPIQNKMCIQKNLGVKIKGKNSKRSDAIKRRDQNVPALSYHHSKEFTKWLLVTHWLVKFWSILYCC